MADNKNKPRMNNIQSASCVVFPLLHFDFHQQKHNVVFVFILCYCWLSSAANVRSPEPVIKHINRDNDTSAITRTIGSDSMYSCCIPENRRWLYQQISPPGRGARSRCYPLLSWKGAPAHKRHTSSIPRHGHMLNHQTACHLTLGKKGNLL